MRKSKKPELLCPARDLEILKAAVDYGADAVYIGGEAYGLRAKARNFTPEEMRKGIEYAHSRGKRVHVTANILAHEADLEGAGAYFALLEELRPDAVLVADMGMFQLAGRYCPHVDRHISTQASCTNSMTFSFWHSLGAKRVVCARELSLEEIARIRQNVPPEMEMEAFVHGAMCVSYSGRCLLSNYLAGRDANRGECAQPCRWNYALVEEKRPGEYLPLEEDGHGAYVMSTGDLCMVEHIPELVRAGLDSLKVEGRMKNLMYVAVCARTYRLAIDDYFESEEKYRARLPWYRAEIRKCTYRAFNTGFYFDRPGPDSMVYDGKAYESDAVYLGTVQEAEGNRLTLSQRNKFSVGEEVCVMKRDGRNLRGRVAALYGEEGQALESAPRPKERVTVVLETPLSEPGTPEKGDVVRRDGPRTDL